MMYKFRHLLGLAIALPSALITSHWFPNGAVPWLLGALTGQLIVYFSLALKMMEDEKKDV